MSLVFYRPTRRKAMYRCAYEIHLNGEVIHTSSAEGTDGVRAILRAMSGIVADLDTQFPKLAAAIPKTWLTALRAISAG